MALTTLDGVIAGARPPQFFAKAASPALVAGRPHSFWGIGGIPGAGAFDTTPAGVALSSTAAPVAGQIWRANPASGEAIIGYLKGIAGQAGSLLVCDRLWHNGGLNATLLTAQTINSAAFPARDANSAINGKDIYIGLEVSAVAGAGAPIATLGYTEQGATAGRTATNLDAIVASSAAGAFHRFGVQPGDYGVRSIQSLTLSATMTSGTINLVAYRVLADLPLSGAFVPNALDALLAVAPRIPNGAVPFLLFIPSTTTATPLGGTYIEAQG